MMSTYILTLAALFSLAYAQINAPLSAIQCQPASISWAATANSPYEISLLAGNATIERLGTFANTSIEWLVDIPAGKSLTLEFRDAAGYTIQSAQFTIEDSATSSCLGTDVGYVGGTGLPLPTTLSPPTSTPIPATPASSSATVNSVGSGSGSLNIAAAVGGAIGGLVILSLAATLLFIWHRKSLRRAKRSSVNPRPSLMKEILAEGTPYRTASWPSDAKVNLTHIQSFK